MEEEDRKRISDAKEDERRQATEELEKWKEHQMRMADEVGNIPFSSTCQYFI